jgi:hypothetical protein
MSIFPRRVIQRLINQSGLRPSQIGSLVDRLNRPFEPNKPIVAFSAEWELVLLSAFQEIGTVEHEPKCPGSKRPDILFTSCEGISFLADITAVSNSGIRVLNPVDAFISALMAKVQEKGLRGNSFWWELRNLDDTIYRGGPRPRLRLCPERLFETRIFNSNFDKFLDGIARRPDIPVEFIIDTPEIYVRVQYKSGQEFCTGHHLAFEYAHSDTENHVFDALDAKARQLRNAFLNVPLGILLCDGGTSLLKATKSWYSYSIGEILTRFFTENADISFVAIFTVQHNRNSDYLVQVELHSNPKHELLATPLTALFDSLKSRLPSPKHSPTNARLRLEEGEPKYKFCYFGGMTMTNRSIRMSARTLIELLAGKMRIEDFTQHYSVDHQRAVNPFLQKLQNGQLISAINFHRLEDSDDEVTIEFGEPDPILTIFRKPAKTVAKTI